MAETDHHHRLATEWLEQASTVVRPTGGTDADAALQSIRCSLIALTHAALVPKQAPAQDGTPMQVGWLSRGKLHHLETPQSELHQPIPVYILPGVTPRRWISL